MPDFALSTTVPQIASEPSDHCFAIMTIKKEAGFHHICRKISASTAFMLRSLNVFLYHQRTENDNVSDGQCV